jgi:sortase (surface protein transpeptidase)
MQRRPSSRRDRLAISLLLGLSVTLPGAVMAGTMTQQRPGPDPVAARRADHPPAAVGTGIDSAQRALAVRGFLPVSRLEGRLGAREAMDVLWQARLDAAGAAAAAQKAAAEKAAAEKAAAAKAAAPAYVGRNHVWIPSLGMSRAVSGFACSRSTPPANQVYRWGCAGRNNVYLFGHAWGVMKPLHDAYVSGRLHKGMAVVYADGSGRVRTYRVTELRVVTPDQTAWAIAAQPVPSMTLQTCVGANSEKRLLVRLVAVD